MTVDAAHSVVEKRTIRPPDFMCGAAFCCLLLWIGRVVKEHYPVRGTEDP